jgi:uncharacterized protein YeaO (DUF488 family)
LIRLKRAYDPPAPEDGERLLVELLWPRGLTKEKAALDLWLKDAAPSPELRKWFSHDPDRWEEFKRRYREELKDRQDIIKILREKSREGTVTFIYAARDQTRNSAVVLREVVEGR